MEIAKYSTSIQGDWSKNDKNSLEHKIKWKPLYLKYEIYASKAQGALLLAFKRVDWYINQIK